MVWFQRFKKFVDNQRSARKMKKDSDFYMVLPSNASPDMHPKNTATDFTVSLQNPIKLDPKRSWTVALMDMCYSHERIIDCGITYRFYGEWRQVYPFKIMITYPAYQVSPKVLNFGNTESAMIAIECSVNKKDDILGFWSKKPFQLKTIRGKEVMSQFHPYWQQFYCNDDVNTSYYFPNKKSNQIIAIDFSITASFFMDQESNFRFPKHILLRSPVEIVHYMIEACHWIFHELHLDNNVVKFGLAERVYSIKFCPGLGELFGFGNKDEFQATDVEKEKLSMYPDYKRALSTFEGNAIPVLHYGNHNLHIFF